MENCLIASTKGKLSISPTVPPISQITKSSLVISPLDKSYTCKLLNDKNLSVSKVKEEIGELIESVEKNSNKIHESADVIYHLMVYLEANNINIEDVMVELKKRQK